MPDSTYSLICPFLNDSPDFAHGVEFGMLYRDMKNVGHRGAILSGYYLIANQEQITLAANRLGWRILKMEPWAEHPDQWFYLEMEHPSAAGEAADN